jgi:hypothetical protein
MALPAMKTRDHARSLVNLVNKIQGKPVLKQPARKGDQGWAPTFKNGGTLSVNRKPLPIQLDHHAVCESGPVSVYILKGRKPQQAQAVPLS